ncbi:MAG: ATP-binding protein [Lachnospiraceae bacterium]|nr:ATP-binding protein [Lachnospiraceae bacterium]
MKIHSVKLTNFKSIGENDHDEIILEPTVTAVIGRNESGKSNVLEGISKIAFIQKMNESVFGDNNINRNARESRISYSIILKRTPDESDLLQKDTVVTISKGSYSVTGGILDYFSEVIKVELDAFYKIIVNSTFQLVGKEAETLQQKRNQIKVGDSLDIPSFEAALIFFEKWKPKVKVEKKEEYNHLLDTIREKWRRLCNFFPRIIYRNEKRTLQTEYRGEGIKTELNNKNSFLYEMFHFLGFTVEEILQAVSNNTDGKTENLREKIQERIDNKINAPFHDFYSVEPVNLRIRFGINILSFYVKADHGSIMTLGERSEGLRWYLNLFIDVMARNITSRQVIYLFDEPGISLHVKAQRELLTLFDDLAEKGNQIIYTTHSPFMLNVKQERLKQIRAVVKDESENTRIYTSVFDPQISPVYQKDTLAPIWSALGADMQGILSPDRILHKTGDGLSDYQNALVQYQSALLKYRVGVYERNVLDDMRLSFELLVKDLL